MTKGRCDHLDREPLYIPGGQKCSDKPYLCKLTRELCVANKLDRENVGYTEELWWYNGGFAHTRCLAFDVPEDLAKPLVDFRTARISKPSG